MSAPAGSSVPTNLLSLDHTFLVFSVMFFLLLLLRKVIKMKVYSPFTIIYPKITMDVVKTISPQQ